MKRVLACNYAVVRFLPYPETQEFVNVGVILMCADVRYFDFRIETRRRDRVTGFFPELEPTVFIRGRRDFGQELQRVKRMLTDSKAVTQMHLPLEDRDFVAMFRELVRPREALFRFALPGTVMCENPHEEVARLFSHYVERQFAQHEDYQENIMVRHLAARFRAHEIVNYRLERLGNDEYHVLFPFVRRLADTPRAVRAIKPLDLAKKEPTRIIEHGDAWLARLHRLTDMGYQPQQFLFALRLPGENQKRMKAAETIRLQLAGMGTNLHLFGETDEILAFAAAS